MVELMAIGGGRRLASHGGDDSMPDMSGVSQPCQDCVMYCGLTNSARRLGSHEASEDEKITMCAMTTCAGMTAEAAQTMVDSMDEAPECIATCESDPTTCEEFAEAVATGCAATCDDATKEALKEELSLSDCETTDDDHDDHDHDDHDDDTATTTSSAAAVALLAYFA